jgi:hypothetical protein
MAVVARGTPCPGGGRGRSGRRRRCARALLGLERGGGKVRRKARAVGADDLVLARSVGWLSWRRRWFPAPTAADAIWEREAVRVRPLVSAPKINRTNSLMSDWIGREECRTLGMEDETSGRKRLCARIRTKLQKRNHHAHKLQPPGDLFQRYHQNRRHKQK